MGLVGIAGFFGWGATGGGSIVFFVGSPDDSHCYKDINKQDCTYVYDYNLSLLASYITLFKTTWPPWCGTKKVVKWQSQS